MNILSRSFLAAALSGGLFSSLLAQNAPAGNGAPQPIGGIQADVTTTSYKFYFGSGDAPAGYSKVVPYQGYTDTVGYGFYRSATPVTGATDKSGNAPHGIITSAKEIYFAAALPEGNYKVTVTFGHPDLATNTSVNAKSRRLMLEGVTTKPGEFVTKTFIVNIRTPKYDGGYVNLKATRETMDEAMDWDKGMTLEFLGDHPSVSELAIDKIDVPTVYVVGDSTSCDQKTEPFNSWGQTITRFFKPEVAVANYGESGETVGDNLGRHRFDKIWSIMKPGDYVMVTSGHNEKNGKNNDMTFDQRFYDDCKRIVDETRKRGGIPILVTPISRAPGSASLGPYPGEMQKLADDEKVAFIDLQVPTATLYKALPNYHIAFASATEATHNSDFGSYEVSKMIMMGIKQDKLDLAKFIVDDFRDFDPAKPDQPSDLRFPPTPNPNRTIDTPPGS